MKKFLKRLFLILLSLILIGCMGCFFYLSDYYHATSEVSTMLREEYDGVKIEKKDDCIYVIPDTIKAGYIFYPGAKVEYTAYLPLMIDLAKEGILCVIPHMTGNFALLEINAAKGITNQYPDLDWYIGGHSLGGVIAGMYASSHTDEFTGMILLASYSTSDLSNSGFKVLSIYGTEDQVLSMSQYEENIKNLPDDYQEKIIQGGNHGNFGDYGKQSGDGKATITKEKQWEITTEYITDFIN